MPPNELLQRYIAYNGDSGCYYGPIQTSLVDLAYDLKKAKRERLPNVYPVALLELGQRRLNAEETKDLALYMEDHALKAIAYGIATALRKAFGKSAVITPEDVARAVKGFYKDNPKAKPGLLEELVERIHSGTPQKIDFKEYSKKAAKAYQKGL